MRLKDGQDPPQKKDKQLIQLEGQNVHGALTFALQSLPNATLLPEGSISKQAKAVVESLEHHKNEGEHWDIHVYALTEKYGIYTKGRSEVLLRKIKTLCYQSQSLKAFKPRFNRVLDRSTNGAFSQILILPDRKILLSHLTPSERIDLDPQLSPFIGGYYQVADDPRPPSRAFKKLVEAQLYMGKKIQKNEHVVDLGACPGGWVHVALDQGATVTAVDRSPLDPKLMNNPRVSFQKADAFKFQTEKPVDWAISDVIAYPERILELIDTWIKQRKCRRFIFTIKFQGAVDYSILEEIKKKAKKLCQTYYLTQLNANKNEATLMGEL